jgi:ppGpp synthetase/RelA/SpoT-type nucleotidyltranferase
MAGLSKKSRLFLEQYESDYLKYISISNQLEKLIREIILTTDIPFHLVATRPKTPLSLRLKILEKKYSNPVAQLTDKLGVRVITYYADGVDQVVDKLIEEFEINHHKSIDKRTALGPKEFGYRSVHIIAKLKGSRVRSPEYSSLAGEWFEIQVRSLLEHAWAEIEHEVVYKSGVKYPKDYLRKFSALAGTLEILDESFRSLRRLGSELIGNYLRDYSRGLRSNEKLDVARLMAILQMKFPDGAAFPRGFEKMCLTALKDIGILTGAKLICAMSNRKFKNNIRSYANTISLEPRKVSHLVIIITILAQNNPNIIKDYFPQVIFDPGINALLRRSLVRSTSYLG